jgi:osmotically inducible protein OsmC
MTEIPAIITPYDAGQATSIGGRDGRIVSDNGALKLELTLPRHLGGRERAGASNPEQLFAAGYAACFGNLLMGMVRQQKLRVGEITVDAHVAMGGTADRKAQLAARLAVNLPDLSQAQAEELVAQAHENCPYSRAVRGNIAVDITVTTHPAQA